MKVDTVPMDSLGPAAWRTNFVLAPDLKVIKASMIDAGWIVPLVAQKDTGVVIDGWHRLRLHQKSPDIKKRWGTDVPVIWMEVDDIDARVWHLRLNRSRGVPIARSVARLVRDLMDSGKYDVESVRSIFNMSLDEIDLLVGGGDLLKVRKVREHDYSPAWVPVEAPPGVAVAPTISIERPPNQDR